VFCRKKRKKTVKKIEGGLWDYMVKYMAEQGVRLSILQSLRMVECNVLVGDKPVGLTIFRIFHPAAVKNEGVTINEYQSLDSHPELILYEGYYETTDGRATNIKIEKKQGKEPDSVDKDDNGN
jgi:hypothetical protein